MSLQNQNFTAELLNGYIIVTAAVKGEYKLYVSDNATSYNINSCAVEFEKHAKFMQQTEDRTFFHIIDNNGQHYVAAVRQVFLKGMDNFRDLGGYITSDNKAVKYGIFYRGGALAFIADKQALHQFEKLNIKTILDLRSKQEIDTLPDIKIKNTQYIAHSALVSMDNSDINFDLQSLCTLGKESLEKAANFVSEGYTQMPFNNIAYKKMFEILLAGETPIYFHCTAGKDRTGIAAALILTALGVPYKTVSEDFMLTNFMRKDTAEKMLKKYGPTLAKLHPHIDAKEVFTLISGVQQKNLDAAFDCIYKKYGDFNNYLLCEYNIDKPQLNELKKQYLV